ncbi:DUF2125 domain-containing protein [Silicimonas algicola]|uniref:DUF2125 domain-containing protein n=1 Tax=Silicimonas algicola TaxID=1826607 RepID=A0A316GDE6_9RHOB|nr:DUF2125 domain-containing protein [Silicimonas algicola]AZQ66274.1 DUF2125 domain-containing protein [Silicimonas algicola]PWK58593.1 hypothetical protein C8D95_101407 [Silicimonas algicola]
MRLVVVVLVGALLWMVWWVIGQIAYEKGLAAWIEDRRNDGWSANYGELNTVGFPSRFDTTVTDVALLDPQSGVAWTAPFVQFLSLSYRPTRVIAVLPHAHALSVAGETVAIHHDDARASIFLDASTSLGLDGARLVVEALEARSDAGWTFALTQGRGAAERVEAAVDTYRLGVEVSDIEPPEPLRAFLDPSRDLADTVSRLHLDATVELDGPLDRAAAESGLPALKRIDLADLSIDWGGVELAARGELIVDSTGRPDGTLLVTTSDWKRLLRMAVETGLVSLDATGALETAFGVIETSDGSLELPLAFGEGLMNLGPIPLGPAPVLR